MIIVLVLALFEVKMENLEALMRVDLGTIHLTMHTI